MFSYLIADNDKLKQGCSAAPTSIIQPPIPKKAMYKYTHLFGQTFKKKTRINCQINSQAQEVSNYWGMGCVSSILTG